MGRTVNRRRWNPHPLFGTLKPSAEYNLNAKGVRQSYLIRNKRRQKEDTYIYDDYNPRRGLTYYVVTRCLFCFLYLAAKDPFLPFLLIKCCIFACISLKYPCVFHQPCPGWGALRGQLGTNASTKNSVSYPKDKKNKKKTKKNR